MTSLRAWLYVAIALACLHTCVSEEVEELEDCTCVQYYKCCDAPLQSTAASFPGHGQLPDSADVFGKPHHYDHSTPDHGTPDHGTPDHGTPDHGMASFPGHGELPHLADLFINPHGYDHVTSDHGTPDHGTPDHGTPVHGTEQQHHEEHPLIDVRGVGSCDHYMEVCCPKDRIFVDEDNSPMEPTPHVNHGCGHRNIKGLNNYGITGAQHGEAQIGEFPWMVALHETKYGEISYLCGGSLISLKVVLTAAHCVAGREAYQLSIRAGEWDTQTTNEQYPYQDRGVKEFVIHEQYYAAALHNDIGLLFLESPVEELANIGTICLPEQGKYFDHYQCIASGWGKDVYGKEGQDQVILKKLELPVVPWAQCEHKLRQTRLGEFFKLHESAICAGGEHGVDTCTGDGGSPLVCALSVDDDHYEQVGIVAWGIGCGGHDTPGVYVNVAFFRHWIDDQMAAHNMPVSSYQHA